MGRRPTPKGGFTEAGNDFTYLRKVEGHIPYRNTDDEVPSVDDYQNAASYNDIFGD